MIGSSRARVCGCVRMLPTTELLDSSTSRVCSAGERRGRRGEEGAEPDASAVWRVDLDGQGAMIEHVPAACRPRAARPTRYDRAARRGREVGDTPQGPAVPVPRLCVRVCACAYVTVYFALCVRATA